MKGFQKALQEYESKMFAPYDADYMTEDEYEDIMTTLGESMMEERRLEENDRSRTDNN